MDRIEELKGNLNAHRQGWTTYAPEQLAAMREELAELERFERIRIECEKPVPYGC